VKEGSKQVTLKRSAEPIVFGPLDSELFVGPYVFEVELAEKGSRWRVERRFEVEESGPPRGADFLRILEPLSYIANSDEIERLKGCPPTSRPRDGNSSGGVGIPRPTRRATKL
jgi:hypothetical protein